MEAKEFGGFYGWDEEEDEEGQESGGLQEEESVAGERFVSC